MPEINALGLLAVLLISSYIIIKYGKRPKGPAVYVAGILGGLFVYAIIIYWYATTNDNGGSFSVFFSVNHINARNITPYHQIIIPLVCITAFFVFIQNRRLQIAGVLLLFASMMMLSSHCRHITKRSSVNTCLLNMLVSLNSSRQHLMRKEVRDVIDEYIGANNSVYHAGWLTEVPCIERLPEGQRFLLSAIEETPLINTSYKWYTPLTGIYHVDQQPVKIWYPGGELQVALGKLEYHPVGLP